MKRQEQDAGGINEGDSNQTFIQEIADVALAYFEEGNTYDNRLRITSILEARQQVCLLLICIVAVVYCTVYYNTIPLIQYS